MVKSNVVSRGIDIKTIIIASFVGLAVTALTAICCSLLIVNEILPFDGWSTISKIVLAFGAMGGCLYVRGKGRGGLANNLLSGALLIIYVFLITIMHPGHTVELGGIILSAAVVVAMSCICSAKARKNSKMHKRRNRK